MNIPTSTMASAKVFPIEVKIDFIFKYFFIFKKFMNIFFTGRLLIALKTDLSDSIDTAPSEVENMPTQTINEVSIYFHSPSKCLAWVKKCHHIWLDQNFDPSLLTKKL